MVRCIFLLIGLLYSFLAVGQEGTLSGSLLDSTTLTPIQFAHVTNYSSKEMVISDVNGRFAINTSVGDTVICSIVGYETLGWEVKKSWLEDGVILKLPQDTIVLQSVTVNNIPSEQIFKQRILEYEEEDTSFWYHGVKKPEFSEDPMLNEKVIRNPLFVATHPLSALYYNFSKQEKERRTYHKVSQNQLKQQRVNDKFSRNWVGEVTKLEGDQLTAFIFYCDYSLSYLDKTPLYLIMEDMLGKLEDFKKGNSEKG